MYGFFTSRSSDDSPSSTVSGTTTSTATTVDTTTAPVTTTTSSTAATMLTTAGATTADTTTASSTTTTAESSTPPVDKSSSSGHRHATSGWSCMCGTCPDDTVRMRHGRKLKKDNTLCNPAVFEIATEVGRLTGLVFGFEDDDVPSEIVAVNSDDPTEGWTGFAPQGYSRTDIYKAVAGVSGFRSTWLQAVGQSLAVTLMPPPTPTQIVKDGVTFEAKAHPFGAKGISVTLDQVCSTGAVAISAMCSNSYIDILMRKEKKREAEHMMRDLIGKMGPVAAMFGMMGSGSSTGDNRKNNNNNASDDE